MTRFSAPIFAIGIAVLCLGADCLARDAAHVGHVGHEVFPGKHWIVASSPAAGWSAAKMALAKQYADSMDTAAVVIVEHGIIVKEWGDTDKKLNVHSIRKSFISALLGIQVSKGTIDLQSTLPALGIDDIPPLTAVERTARVIDLLKARSGIYHPALLETQGMQDLKPPRGSHPPNTFWYYNNWDFNALGTILEKATKTSVFDEFNVDIAQPLQMEDFDVKDNEYVRGDESIHPGYRFRMTARDMARFGLLYLRNGNWNGRQIVPRDWIRKSTTAYSVADGNESYGYSGYGYLWWVAINGNHIPNARLPDGTFSAQGYRGHYIVVIPSLDLVVVHRVNTDVQGTNVELAQFGHLLQLILDAKDPVAPRR